jgi:hypothetical protein
VRQNKPLTIKKTRFLNRVSATGDCFSINLTKWGLDNIAEKMALAHSKWSIDMLSNRGIQYTKFALCHFLLRKIVVTEPIRIENSDLTLDKRLVSAPHFALN